ncbi:MAG: transcription antitermination factor NusB [Bacteroidota bacterium]
MRTRRRIVRERVLQVLYAHELSKEPVDDIIASIMTDLVHQPDAYAFARDLVHRVVEHQTEIDRTIQKRVTNWEFSRIAVIDRVLLRIGICEFLYFEDIPPKVTINEVIEIAKRYSTEKSGQFVNGVLDSVLADLRKEGLLQKSGRGLIDETLRKH